MHLYHRYKYGHWFKPHVIAQDEYYFDLYMGCDTCFGEDPKRYMLQLHNRGQCPKGLQGYDCKGRKGECGTELELQQMANWQ